MGALMASPGQECEPGGNEPPQQQRQLQQEQEVIATISAHTGAKVIAPIITNCIIQGNVSFQEETKGPEPIRCEELLEDHKKRMKEQYDSVFCGLVQKEHRPALSEIYTPLYITEGESEEVNSDHEIWQIETANRKQRRQHTEVSINDIFEDKKHIRTVMTKGVAGVGKTVSVHKFIVDWAEGKANQHLKFIICLPFRELNHLKDEEHSLQDLVFMFNNELKPLRNTDTWDKFKGVFIFDGLDECRFPLKFKKNKPVFEVHKKASLDLLITSLLTGNLLRSASVWVTSRPAAADLVPIKHIHRFTEVRGFNDAQKLEYFQKRLAGNLHTEKIITHIKTTKSLFIMCHIPVFCCIAATVMEDMLKRENTEKIPKTLTEMYVHFLYTQLQMTNEKFNDEDIRKDRMAFLAENKDGILKLAELAFRKLEGTEGSILFYEDDLKDCGINLEEASVLCGLCTEIFKVEPVLFEKRFYSFVHLSIQEFLAALHVFASFRRKDLDSLKPFLEKKPKKVFLYLLLKSAIDKALQSKNGHLDLFVRFLVGISLETNNASLKGLLPEVLKEDEEDNKKSMELISKYIKGKVQAKLSPERFINLMNCLTELKDNSVHQELLRYLQYDKSAATELTAAHCSALANMILLSEEPLEMFDLERYNVGDEGRERLVPAVRWSIKARLAGCKLTANCGEIVASALQSDQSPLRVLDLERSDLTEPGLKAVCSGLTSPYCKLRTLSLAGCRRHLNFTCEVLGKALQSVNPHLIDLDMSCNMLCSKDMKDLTDGLKSPACKVEKLRLRYCSLDTSSCEKLASVFRAKPCNLRELDLGDNKLNDMGMQLLSEAMKSSTGNLEKLRLSGCHLTEVSWRCLTSVFQGELDLSESRLLMSELEQLSAALRSPDCKVKVLRLKRCFLMDEHCEVLASVLSSEGSHLEELDLNDNDLHDSGVELLSSGLKSLQCTLEILRLSFCGLTEKGCEFLASALSANPSYLRELDLSYNHPGETGVKLLSERKDDPDCKLDTLNVNENAECWMKSGLRKYACEFTWDTNTMHNQLFLTDSNERVSCTFQEHNYPCHTERFQTVEQVLAAEGFTGRCYWEAECEGFRIYLGMTYKGVERKGGGGRLGHNDQSWAVRIYYESPAKGFPDYDYTVCHDNKMIRIESPGGDFKRIGVYLDHEAGTLSFYGILEDNFIHLHTFKDRFKEAEALYPGIGFVSPELTTDDRVLLCKIRPHQSDKSVLGMAASKKTQN